MTAPAMPPLCITAEEVNCLIHAYLQDSGFTHSAFAIRMESQLERSPYALKHIRRGELIELLSKALLYIEVESHWKGDFLASNCKSPFSILEPHVCSLEQPSPVASLHPTSLQMPISKVNDPPGLDPPIKRKSSPTAAPKEWPAEKRQKNSSAEPEQPKELSKTKTQITPEPVKPVNGLPESASKRPPKKKLRKQGPGDDTTDPKSVLLLSGHTTEVFVCAFNPSKHELLATGSKDAIVNLWTLSPSPPDPDKFAGPPAPPLTIDYFTKPEQGDLTSLHWNADGSLVAIGSYDSVLRICTVTGALHFQHPQHQGPIFAARFSKSSRWLLTASLDGTTCLWDVDERRLYRQYRCHTDCCLDVDWLDENTFATCGADQLIHVMRADEMSPIKTLSGHKNEINQIKCNPAGTRLASCSDDMTARIWNIEGISSPDNIPGLVASNSVVTLEGHKHSVSTIAWCPNTALGAHPLIATSSFDTTARIWDSVTGECLKIFEDHNRPLYTLTFSPDGHWLATGSGDGWLHVYNVLAKEKRWSWFAGTEKPGVFEIDWQEAEGVNRIALALECRQVAIIDVRKMSALNYGKPL